MRSPPIVSRRPWARAGAVVLGAFGALALGSCGSSTTTTDLCKGRQAGDLVLTEFMLDPDGTDTGQEWIELFNALGSEVDLKGVQVYTKKADGTGMKAHSIRAGTVAARSYFTLGDVRTGPNPAYIGYSYGDALGGLTNSDGIIGLRCGTVVLDEVTYTKAGKAARSRMLGGTSDPDATANDDETKWCDTDPAKTYSGNNAGTPMAPNGECPVEVGSGSCLDGASARPIVHPGPGDLVISELMADPKAVADTAGEWLEVMAVSDVDLNGVTVAAGASKSTLTNTQCLHVAAGEYAVIARSADPAVNGGIASVKATMTLSLANSGGVVTLSLPDAGLDQATLPAAVAGTAWQLGPTKLDAVSNDDPANFCRATARYGNPDAGDFGTPGLANTSCPLAPDPNSCIDNGTGQVRAIVTPVAGDLAITEVMADPNAVSDTTGEWFEVRANQAVDLNNLTLGNEGTTKATVASQSCVHLEPGEYAVFAKSADPAVNGGLPFVTSTFTFSLSNSGTRFVTVSAGATELDRWSYTTATAGASSQLKAGLTAPTDNDVAANLCPTPAGTTYGGGASLADGGVTTGDRGTPGADNVACP